LKKTDLRTKPISTSNIVEEASSKEAKATKQWRKGRWCGKGWRSNQKETKAQTRSKREKEKGKEEGAAQGGKENSLGKEKKKY